ncbi:MAG: peptide ABC transporter substrate-binding protein [Patescibacteria group bacterium]|nr:peptide ABC transporter substrate-binding protein [Patescibacteria group bacterium]
MERAHKVKKTLVKERRIPRAHVLETLVERLSAGERLVMYGLAIVLALSTLAIISQVNGLVSVTTPVDGGTMVEGEVGPARFLNPLLTLSGPDEDIAQLVYSGLMRALPNGSYIPDLASSYDISSDGTTYTFHIRPEATFHDGTPLTAADVLFTISLAQNPDIHSPRQADWVGVQVSSPDEYTVQFKLPHPYAPFMENSTMGILPKHLWSDVSAEEFPFNPLNTHPVGSGPYRVGNFSTDSTGSATRYDLEPFSGFTLGKPYLKRISFIFYANEADLIKAFNDGRVDAVAGISPEDLASITRTDVNIASVALPRTFGVFFNQNRAPVLADASVRAALTAAIDKNEIVQDALKGFGTALDGPVPPGVLDGMPPVTPSEFSKASAPESVADASAPNQDALNEARAILEKGGWKYDEDTGSWSKNKQILSFVLATADEPTLKATADKLAESWKALGVQVSVQVYALSEFNTNILRPRAYDAILFGEVVGRSLDLFAFWHSSQRNDPGLNLAMYTNSHADSLLSEARAATITSARNKLYAEFSSLIAKDQPAIFLYAPKFIYLVPRSLHGVELGVFTSPSERFLNAHQWYTDTARIWSIFSNR